MQKKDNEIVDDNFYCFYDSAYTMPAFGLGNTGSICWFNSILQMLFSLPAFNMAILDAEISELSAGGNHRMFLPDGFAGIYCRIIKSQQAGGNNGTRKLISAELINAFGRELDRKKKRVINGQEGAANGFIEIIQMIDSKYVYDCMNNKYKRIIVCDKCREKVSVVDELSPLINIYRQTNFADEKDFKKFIRYHVTKVDKYTCDKCKNVMRDFNRLEQLTMLREVIIFTFNTDITRWYPGTLSLLSKNMKMLRYILVAQIEHSGNYNKITHQSSGHYCAKVYRGGEWYHADDAHVSKVAPENLIKCDDVKGYNGNNEFAGHHYPAPTSRVHMIAYHLIAEDDMTESEKHEYEYEMQKNHPAEQ